MKTSVLLFLTDILSEKRRLFNKIVKNKIFSELPPKKAFLEMKNAGIEGIEVLLPGFETAQDLQDLKVAMDAYDMKIYSVHQALRFLSRTRLPEIEKIFQTAKFLSAKVAVLHMNSAGKQVFDPYYIKKIHSLQDQYGIKAGFENMEKHAGSILNGVGWDQKKFADLMEKNDFHITLDICHIGQSGGDIIKFIENHMDRIINIHLSDYKKNYLNNSLRPMRYKHMPLGKGQLPINEFISLLKRKNYKGLLTLEIETNLDGILESAAVIKTAS
ncbi:MAG TPA: sugar phosphate isomerase/epimerase family protein [Candidatus Limnocylindrales bacterium]|nr:sugar phosphate isomerase/epimerase family protein [Candidatus Limnocylindrales bacterium]